MVSTISSLAFAISPAKKQAHKNNGSDEDDNYILTLAPFTQVPKINFGQIKPQQTVEKNLLIVNPQQFRVELNVVNGELNINNIKLTLDKGEQLNLKLKWQPVKPDNYKYAILFEVLNSARLKFVVHAFGVCIKPDPKKSKPAPRRPFTVLQPVNETKKNGQSVTVNRNETIILKVNNATKPFVNRTQTVVKTTKYNNDFYNNCIDETTTTTTSTTFFEATTIIDDGIDRRQTNIIRTPRLNLFKSIDSINDLNLDVNLNSPRMRRTSSMDELLTPNRRLFAPNVTRTCKKSPRRDEQIISHVIVCQRSWRMKQFRKHLALVKHKIRTEKALIIQRQWRMKQFRKHLALVKHINRTEKALIIQRQWRMIRFRRSMAHYRQSATRIQTVWRAYRARKTFLSTKKAIVAIQKLSRRWLQRRLNACLTIQSTWRMTLARREYKSIRNATCLIQTWYRRRLNERHNRLVQAALFLQSTWRMKTARRDYLKHRAAAIRIQKWYRAAKHRRETTRNAVVCIQSTWRMIVARRKFQLLKQSAVKIQTWFRNGHQRLAYLRLKRSIVHVQRKARQLLERRHAAARTLQLQYRYVKFRRCMARYQHAIVTIQAWTRSMRARYDYLKLRRVVVRIQVESRAFLTRKKRLDEYAVRIQALWKGYRVRKMQQRLNTQRRQLDEASSLGVRIRKSLEVLKYPDVSIQHLVMTLNDLHTVTRLSPECCELFVRERATECLFKFILNCNRSVPHQDLIKFCLDILINLAKYRRTAECILSTTTSVTTISVTPFSILLNLIQSYHLTNANLFSSVCLLFALLGKHGLLKRFVVKDTETMFSKKLLAVHATLSKRASCKSVSMRPMTIRTFNFEPDWTLNKNLVEFNDSLAVLEYLLASLGLWTKSSSAKRPKPDVFLRKNNTKKIVNASKNATAAAAEHVVKLDDQTTSDDVNFTIRSVTSFFVDGPNMNSTKI